MLDGVHAAQRQQLQLLASAKEYRFLNRNDCYKVDRMNDKEEWGLTKDGMQAMGMSDQEIDGVLRVLSAVLWLGQLEFVADGADRSRLQDERPIGVVASLLGCDAKVLLQGMSARTFTANNSSVLTPLNVDQARYTRDALAKAIYFRLFDYIVHRINDAIQTNGGAQQGNSSASSHKVQKKDRSIGVLDIYGVSRECPWRLCVSLSLISMSPPLSDHP